MHSFFYNLFQFLKELFAKNKLLTFLLFLVAFLGICFGVFSAIKLKGSLTLEEISDVTFLGAIDDYSFFEFYFARLCFVCAFLLLLIFFNSTLLLPIILYFVFSHAYFFIFNLLLLIFNLNLIGLFYIVICAFPIYLLYIFCYIPCLVFYLDYVFQKKKFCCLKNQKTKLRKIVVCSILLYCFLVLYESVMLFAVFSKYPFIV